MLNGGGNNSLGGNTGGGLSSIEQTPGASIGFNITDTLSQLFAPENSANLMAAVSANQANTSTNSNWAGI